MLCQSSVASTDIATEAVQRGARLITHLFNAMPQLHHRDPSIIGLLGASPHLASPTAITAQLPCTFTAEPVPLLELPEAHGNNASKGPVLEHASEAFEHANVLTRKPTLIATKPPRSQTKPQTRPTLHLDKGYVADMTFERPYYGIIVDGIHCHPNSVRVCHRLSLFCIMFMTNFMPRSWLILATLMDASLSRTVRVRPTA